jgi:AraC-like DNA-binding protein
MSIPPADYVLAASYLHRIVRLAALFGVSEEDLLRGLEIRPEDMTDPTKMTTVATAAALAERARRLTGEPGLGVYLGRQMYSPEHGALGFATMSAATLGDALDLLVRYSSIRTNAFAFALTVDGPTAALVVEEFADFGAARDLVLLSLLIGLRHTAVSTLGRERDTTMVELTIPEPSYYERFRRLRPRVMFGCPRNALVFESLLLEASLATAAPASHQLALEQCWRLSETSRAPEIFRGRVGRLILREEGGLRSIGEVAEALQTSTRTLRRRLAAENTTFAAIREEECRERAVFLLRSGKRSTAEVSECVGYANVANFTRAFQRWTGHTPGTYRRSVGEEPPSRPSH